jgi:SWI/SNF-related matrix-associated actin-dependent regulator 1 of chromatin subfamily A
LSQDVLVNSSGKMVNLVKLLKQCHSDGKRVLVFSQMTRLLDIVQEVLTHRGTELLRLDGQTPVLERQQLVDSFNTDPKISVFLLSTKAGGVGITLTAAQAVVFLDLSFNPQWDRQLRFLFFLVCSCYLTSDSGPRIERIELGRKKWSLCIDC